MTKLPERYSAAKKALATAVRVDEVKDIRDKAHAMRVYAIQAKDGQLAADATEIKMRATRRLGELMEEKRKAGTMAKGTRGRIVGPGRGKRKTAGSKKPHRFKETALADHVSLADQGIDKNLAKRAREAAKKSDDKFEKEVTKAKSLATAAAEGNKGIITAARAERHAAKKASRAAKERELAEKIVDLPERKFGVIYADPEWQFEFFSEKGKTNSSADNHYTTSAIDVIKDRDVESISAKDSVIFLWATVPMLPQALEVMDAWGFKYKSNFAWVKDKTGTGYWNRNQHELLLVGTKGNIPAPAEGEQWPSVITAPRERHSKKPDRFYELIEAYYPTLPKIELNARSARDGWTLWGNEAPELEAAE